LPLRPARDYVDVMASNIPADVRQLVRVHLQTMSHVDTLAALVGSPQELTAVDVAERMFMSPEVAQACLADLVMTGLARPLADGEPPRYRYEPVSAQDALAVDALMVLRNSRPVSLVRFVYEGPTRRDD
jgi:hypothetical protein